MKTRHFFQIIFLGGLGTIWLSWLSVCAETSYSLGIDIDSAFDSNATLSPEWNDQDTDTAVIDITPWVRIDWKTPRNDFRMDIRSIATFYPNTDHLDEHLSIDSQSWWTFAFTDSFFFAYEDVFDYSGQGEYTIDRPEFTGDFMEYVSRPGLRMIGSQFQANLDLIWGMMEWENMPDASMPGLRGVDWHDLGFKASGSFEVISAMTFFGDCSIVNREFADDESVPEAEIADASAGFKSILPSGTVIILKGLMFHIDYGGTPPRHTESDYHKYGARVDVEHRTNAHWNFSVSGYSEFKPSSRDPRLFYRDAGFSGSMTFRPWDAYTVGIIARHDRLNYHGLEIETEEDVYQAELMVSYQVTGWFRLTGRIRHFQRDTATREQEIDSTRFGIRCSFILPAF
ncbi:hypothetical protein JXA80_10990 [bacterium]|nr:hypothetical protein [candidate division CSSED10-310 bacterium]